jgi:muramoyltetrapeptide carboxypeptidase
MKLIAKTLTVSLTLALALNCASAEKKVAEKQASKGNADVEIFSGRDNKANLLKGILPADVKNIACIAAGSYPGSAGYKKGIELLKQAGYNVKVMPHAFEKPAKGKGSAKLEHRVKDFVDAWNDKEIDMILCIRGGRGCGDVMQAIDWSKLPKRPELYVQGYSDVTMILCALQKRNYGHPVAGPMVGAMQGLVPDALKAMRNMHHNKQVGPVKVAPIIKGDCEGLPLAGLLSRFAWVVKTSDRPITKDRIIFIESVAANEKQMREYFQTLIDEKFFEGAAGVVFCCFTKTGTDQKTVNAMLKEIAPKLGVPVYMNFPFGHRNISYTIDYSRKAVIKNNTVTFPAK